MSTDTELMCAKSDTPAFSERDGVALTSAPPTDQLAKIPRL